ncbi:MAG TPA: Fe-S cluster assembly protein SufD [Candidatus Thermoplasmatota archaeon]|nr:Fe-S cluster assembly protein SufD [Candidatus Thermoplasmatota archaeon]
MEAEAMTRPATGVEATFRTGGWAKRGPGFLREARGQAIATLAAVPVGVGLAAFLPIDVPARLVREEEVAPYRLPDAIELVFVDGHEVPALHRVPKGLRGITVQALSAALLRPTETLEHHLARHADADQPVVALNTAFLQDGAFLDLAAHTIVEEPVHFLHLATEPRAPTACHVRHLIVAGPHSEATVVESYVGLASPDAGLTTAVTELVAGEGAHIQHVKLQRENLHARHEGMLTIRQDRDSVVNDHLFSVGGATARSGVDAILGSPGGELRLGGLFLATGAQRVECPTRIDHAVHHTTSREVYKGILDGAARGSFLGSVKVRADAQKTDSAQQNRNLLLSDQALMHSVPQLEIHADDVKCSHGSTTGQLSPESLFFLRSRGLDPEHARLILTQAFAQEVIDQMPSAVQPLLHDLLGQWFACRKVAGVLA